MFETGPFLTLELIVLLDWIVSGGTTVFTGPALGLQATIATHRPFHMGAGIPAVFMLTWQMIDHGAMPLGPNFVFSSQFHS